MRSVMQQGRWLRCGPLRAALEAECSTSCSAAWQRGACPASQQLQQREQQQRGYAADNAEGQKQPKQPAGKQKQQNQKKGPRKGVAGAAAAGAAAAGAATAGAAPTPPAAAQPSSEPADKPWHSALGVASALAAPVGLYFDAPLAGCPEAAKKFYEDPLLADERVNQPNFGCRGVQQEYAATGHEQLLQRTSLQLLLSSVAEQRKGQLYLDGWAGSGKSVALFAAVSWARANGWVALYVPSAYSLVQGGFFSKGEDGLWETPWAARYILTATQASHKKQLQGLKARSGESLADLVARGLAAEAPGEAVGAAIALKEELSAQKEVPVLLAVDDYNVLYSHTGYYESMHSFYRRPIAPDELRLARAFRLLEQAPPAHGVVLAAPTFGQTVSDKVAVPRPRGTRFAVPRYSLAEVEATAEYYRGINGVAVGEPRSELTLRKALFLTNGNAKELRQYVQVLLNEEDPLGVSLGYKAADAAVRAYDQSWESLTT